MKASLFRLWILLSLFGLVFTGTASAQDFQKSYRLEAGGRINVGNISGDVIVTGYDGDAVLVKAFKKGRDRDLVQVEDRSSSTSVDVVARYPEACNCDASINFEVQVPRSTSYLFDSVSSISGSVEVGNVTGQVEASSISGDVRVKAMSGAVSASTISGTVEVDITRLEGLKNMKFSSVSGNVSVRLPDTLSAEIDMSSFSGSIRTDFPLEVRKEEHGPRRWARGQVGEGSPRSLRMSSISGDLSLRYR